MTWDSPSVLPDEFQIIIADKDTAANNPIGYFENVKGSLTSHTIPTGDPRPL